MAKKVKESIPAEESVAADEMVEKAVAVVPEPEPMPEPIRIPPSSGPTVGQRVGRFIGLLFRLFLVLIVLAVIGAGLYFGLPLLYQRYILPVEENTSQLQQLRSQQIESEQVIAELQTRLNAIETRQVEQAESLAVLDERVTGVETEIAAHTQTLAALDEMQAKLQSQSDATDAELKRQIDLLKAMELLSRARLYMYQSNFGLAKLDAQSARDLLVTVQSDAPASLTDDLDAVLLRLDLALSNMPDFPVAASDDLDIAWQILLGGVPAARPQPTVSQTPSPVVTFTPTPQVTLEATPTP